MFRHESAASTPDGAARPPVSRRTLLGAAAGVAAGAGIPAATGSARAEPVTARTPDFARVRPVVFRNATVVTGDPASAPAIDPNVITAPLNNPAPRPEFVHAPPIPKAATHMPGRHNPLPAGRNETAPRSADSGRNNTQSTYMTMFQYACRENRELSPTARRLVCPAAVELLDGRPDTSPKGTRCE